MGLKIVPQCLICNMLWPLLSYSSSCGSIYTDIYSSTWFYLTSLSNSAYPSPYFLSHICLIQMAQLRENEEEVVRSRFKNACVFCGSRSGRRESYKTAAIELGKELVSRKIGLVYGGGRLGLMGGVAQAVHEGGGHVVGIIPRDQISVEITGETFGEEISVMDMHQRKAEMARRSDCFIALPGGYGTLDELLEVVSWSRYGIHDKPVGLLNVDGFFDHLFSSIDNGVDEGFINASHHHIIIVAANAKDLIEKLEVYVPMHERTLPKESWEVKQQEEQLEIQQVGFNVAPAVAAMQPVIALEKREKKRRRD